LRSYGGLKSQDEKSIFAFLEKRPLRENLQNSVPTGFISTAIDVFRSNFVKFSRREIGKIVRYTTEKKQNLASLSSSRYCANRAQNLPGKCIQSAPDFNQIGSLSAELYPNA